MGGDPPRWQSWNMRLNLFRSSADVTSKRSQIEFFEGTATPEGAQTGDPGDIFFDRTNGAQYVKKTGSGNTGWVNLEQTIALTGNVTGSGTGSFATTISASVIIDSMVSGSAAVAGTKISPNFGAQEIITTGAVTLGTAGTSNHSIRFNSLELLGHTGASSVLVDYLASVSAGQVLFRAYNFNTASSSADAVIRTQVGGVAAGSPYYQCRIDSGADWSFGANNAVSNDPFQFCRNALIGTSVFGSIDSTSLWTLGSVGSTVVHKAEGGFHIGRNVGIGAAPTSLAMLYVAGNILTTTNQFSYYTQFSGTSAATGLIKGFVADVATTAAAFTCTSGVAYDGGFSAGSGSTVTYASIFNSSRGISGAGTVSNSAHFTNAATWSGSFFILGEGEAPSFIPQGLTVGGGGFHNTVAGIRFTGANILSGASQFSIYSDHAFSSSATTAAHCYYAQWASSTGTYTTPIGTAFFAAQSQKGAGSVTLTRLVNFFGFSQTDGTNNAWGSDTQTGWTGNYFIYNEAARPSFWSGYQHITTQADPGAVTDAIRLGSQDVSAGNATVSLRTETGLTTETVTSDRTLSIYHNGTLVKVLIKS